MNINIIEGAYSEQNISYIFNLLKTRDKTKNHIIIAPDRTQFNLERRLFENLGEKCFFDINIISLTRLCKKTLGNSDKKILSKQSGVALVSKIVSDNKDKLSAFSKATGHIGFATNLFETICLYKSCGISPEDVYVDDSLSFSNLKQKDIKFVYTMYENYLSTKYTDSFNRLKVFADSINSETFKNTIFYFVEFDDFTKLMYDIILKLAKFSDATYITCTYSKNTNNKNIYSNKVYYDLVELFKTNGIMFSSVKLHPREDKLLSILSENLLAYNTVDCEKISTDKIRVFAFENIYDEIKYIISDLYSNILTNGGSYSDYTLVVPSLNDYESEISDVLNSFGIPFYIDKSSYLSDNYLIRLLFSIVTVILKDYKLYDFCDILKSPVLNIDNTSVCKFSAELKSIGAISDMCLNKDLTDDKQILQLIDFILDTRLKIVKSQNISDYLNSINSIFDFILEHGKEYFNKIDQIQSRTISQVISKFESIVDDCNTVFGNEQMNFEEFVKVFYSYFKATTISLPPISSNTLFVADFNSSFISLTKHLYILGCNDGKLPSLNLDNGLVTDDEIASLPNGKKLTPTISMLNARKTFKLFELVFKFENTLTLSFLKSCSEGKLYPNSLVTSICNILNITPENQSGVLDLVSRNFWKLDYNNVIFNNLTPNILGKNLIGLLSDWKIYCNNDNYRTLLSTLYNVAGVREQKIADNSFDFNDFITLRAHNFLNTNRTSISEIESFYNCPYSHFVRYGLKLNEPTENTLKPNDIGTIIHEVLRYAVPFMSKNLESLDESLKFANDKLSNILKEPKYLKIATNKNNNFVIKALYKEMDRIITAISKQLKNCSFVPSFYEYRFDEIDFGKVKLKGFIDRIDTLDDGFIVIDYKTGDNEFKDFSEVYSGKKLQLLIYADAYSKISKKSVMGAFYLPISNAFGQDFYKLTGVMVGDESNIFAMDKNLMSPSYSSNVVNLKTTSGGKIYSTDYYKNLCISRSDFDYLLSFTRHQVDKAISSILSGEISPNPLRVSGKDACSYCRYLALCNHKDQFREVDTIKTIDELKQLGEEDGEI